MTAIATTSTGSTSNRAALRAFAWTAVFILWHGYWALGGDFGFGDQEAGFPDTTSSASGWVFTVAVVGMFGAGLAVPLAVARRAGPRRLLTGLMWAGAVLLAARGVTGLVDDGLRFGGVAETGLSGLSDQEVLGTADPSAYTIWSTVGLDSFFVLGGLLFGWAALRDTRWRPLKRLRIAGRERRSLAWAAYVACGWAIAYAIGVRGYQGLGGTIGLGGTLEDPEGMRRASLTAGAVLLLVGLGALAFVRPWGLLIPRWLVIVPALAGSTFAMGHALTGYVTKSLDILGVVDLEFRGWVERDERTQFLWDLLFYEPWFFGLGIFVTLGALHHHRRTGGSARAARRLVAGTAAATLALTVVASAMVL